MAIKSEGGMSAFERKRLANIEANREVLTDISATAKKIIKPKPKPATPVRKSRRSEPVKRESARPTRTSSRLAGIEADSETLKRKHEVEVEAQAEAAKAKKMRVSGDLNLGDIVVEGKRYGGIDGIKGLVRGAQPGVRTFTEDDVKETTDKGLKDLRLRMGKLELYEHWAPNGKLHINPPSNPSSLWEQQLITVPRHQNHTTKDLRCRISSDRRQANCVCWRQGGKLGSV
jgi:WD repeat-containing protein 76